VRLFVLDSAALQYTADWTAEPTPEFMRWIRDNDPGAELVLYNATTLIVNFATTEGAFAFKLRYC
jgi:hypothetical protein